MRRVGPLRVSLPDTWSPFVTVHHIRASEAQEDGHRPHFHPDTLEVCSVRDGRLDWVIDGTEVIVSAGDVLILPAGCVHGAVDSHMQPCDLRAVHIAVEQLTPRVSAAAQELGFQRIRNADLDRLVDQVIELHRHSTDLAEEKSQALGDLIAIAIMENASNDAVAPHSLQLRRAMKLLTEGGERITVGEVARKVGVSDVWLHRIFVRHVGASPGDWARWQRLARAKQCLRSTEEPILGIAAQVGYASGQSLAAAFRQEYGMTPMEYRASHQQGLFSAPAEPFCVPMRETWINGIRTYPPASVENPKFGDLEPKLEA